MHTSSSWISKSSELTLKFFVRSVPNSLTKILLNLPPKKKWFHLSRNSGTLASLICYLRSIQIICTSPGEHLLLSSIGASQGSPQSTSVQMRDTPNVSVSKKKVPTTTDRSKGIDLLFEAALLEDAQMKKVLDELQDKTTGTNEGTGTISGVLDVPKDQSECENESWGKSGDDDDSNDDDVSDDDGNDDDSDDDGSDNDSDNERTESDEDENPNLNQNDDDIEEEYADEYELYKDVNVKLKDVEQGEEGKGDAEKTDAGHDDVNQETAYDQVEDDAEGHKEIQHKVLQLLRLGRLDHGLTEF
ncbi:hypothetical protein Tco_0526872 [Tanacetum coccineum]